MLKLTGAAVASALLLAACGPSASELDGNLEVNGMDPVFWGVKVDRAAKTTTVAVVGSRDLQGELPVRSEGEKGAAILTTKTPEGDFVMTLQPEACKDGLGEREYHWSATANWQGETLKGCAAPAAK